MAMSLNLNTYIETNISAYIIQFVLTTIASLKALSKYAWT